MFEIANSQNGYDEVYLLSQHAHAEECFATAILLDAFEILVV